MLAYLWGADDDLFSADGRVVAGGGGDGLPQRRQALRLCVPQTQALPPGVGV